VSHPSKAELNFTLLKPEFSAAVMDRLDSDYPLYRNAQQQDADQKIHTLSVLQEFEPGLQSC
jgi:hypothetical protein